MCDGGHPCSIARRLIMSFSLRSPVERGLDCLEVAVVAAVPSVAEAARNDATQGQYLRHHLETQSRARVPVRSNRSPSPLPCAGSITGPYAARTSPVGNLGGSAAGGLIEMDEAIWDGQVEFKVKGVSLARKCALPQMISRRSVTSAVGATIRDDKLGRAKLCAKPCLQSSMVAMTERCIRLACCQVGQSPNWVAIDRSGASARASELPPTTNIDAAAANIFDRRAANSKPGNRGSLQNCSRKCLQNPKA